MTYPHSAILKRTTKSGTKYTYGDNGTTECFLQPLDIAESQSVGITVSKGSYCYMPYATDIQMGDRAEINSVTYGVKGVEARDYGSLKHKKVLLEQI